MKIRKIILNILYLAIVINGNYKSFLNEDNLLYWITMSLIVVPYLFNASKKYLKNRNYTFKSKPK